MTQLLIPDREHVDAFSQVPIVVFRRAKILKYILVREKLHQKDNEYLVVGNVGQVDVMIVTV